MKRKILISAGLSLVDRYLQCQIRKHRRRRKWSKRGTIGLLYQGYLVYDDEILHVTAESSMDIVFLLSPVSITIAGK